MIDPRGSVVEKRLRGVRRIIGFCSAKGGVGKTTCTAVSAVILAGAGKRVGVLDLDLQGASAHLVLGVRPRLPTEDKGIVPLAVSNGLSLLSAAAFAGERGLALRGREVSDALLELLAVTIWGELDALLVDMPPGIGEEVLDLARLMPRLEAVVVSTPSLLSVAVVERLIRLLAEMHVSVAGIVANEARGNSGPVRDLATRTGVPVCGELPFDEGLEEALGSPRALAGCAAARALEGALVSLGLM